MKQRRKALALAAMAITSIFAIATPRPAYADCTSPAGIAGDIDYSSASKTFLSCDGTSWIDMKRGGTPTLAATLEETDLKLTNPAGVAVSGNYAFVGNEGGSAITVLNVTNLESPSIVTHLVDETLLAGVRHVYVSGNYLYALADNRMVIINVTTPATPTIVGSIEDSTSIGGANASRVFVTGGYAYVTNLSADRFSIFNVSNPASPTLSASLQSSTSLDGASGVFVDGNYAYVANYFDDQVTIINVTNKSSPTVQGSVSSGIQLDSVYSVYVSGNYAYAIPANREALTVIDITNKSSPSILTYYESIFGTASQYIEDPREICGMSGNILFVKTNGTNAIPGVSSFDVSDPANPQFMSRALIGDNGDGDYCHMSGNKLVTTSYYTNNVYTFDTSSKADVDWDATGTVLNPASETLYNAAVSSDGNYLYTVDYPVNGLEGRLYVYDISSPATPTVVTNMWLGNGQCRGIDLNATNSHAFISCNAQMMVVNISTPSSPSIVTTLSDSTNLTAGYEIDVEGNYAYVATEGDRLTIIDITTPATPSVTGSLLDATNLSDASSVHVVGNYAYVTAYNTDRLTIVDITNKASPTVVGSLQDSTNLDTPRDVKVVGNYAYVTAETPDRLNVINVTTKTAPVLAGSVAGLNGAYEVEISGSYAYVTLRYNPGGVAAVNISNPAAPTVSNSQLNDTYIPVGLAIYGTSIFATNSRGEVVSYNIATPTNITFNAAAGHLGTTSGIEDLDTSADGNYLYTVSDTGTPYDVENDRIDIYNISNKSNPTHVGTLRDNANMTTPNSADYDSGYFYVADDGSAALLIYNVSTPASPTYSGKLTGLTGASGVFVSGNYAYVTSCSGDRLSIVNITNKAAPSLSGSVTNATSLNCATDVVVAGNYAYIAASSADALTVVDVTNKSSPSVVGTLSDAVNMPSPIKINISGNYAFLDTYDGNGYISIANISNPTAPTFEGKVTYSNQFFNDPIPLNGGEQIVSPSGWGSLQFFDAADKTDPVHIKYIGVFPINTSGTSSASLTGNYLVTGFNRNSPRDGIAIHEVLTGPVTYRDEAVLNDSSRLKTINDIAMSGSYAFVLSYDTDRLTSIDISDPLNPTIVGTLYGDDDFSNAYSVSIAGNYAYVVDTDTDDLVIIDISTPSAPSVVSSISPGTDPQVVYSDGSYAYILRPSSDSMRIVEVTNPLVPVSRGSYTNSSMNFPESVAVSGNYAYIADRSTSLWIVNATTKTSLSLGAQYTDATYLNNVYKIIISGTLAYVMTSDRITILDITTPTAPTVVGSVQDASKINPSGINVYNNGLFLDANDILHVTSDAGLTLVDVSIPANPRILGNYEQGAFIGGWGTVAAGNYSFVPYEDTFYVFNVTLPITDGACTTEGQLEYKAASHVWRFCDGTTWYTMGPMPGTGGAGCSSPSAAPSALNFTSASGLYQYCDGTNWVDVD
ncbi:LVIVD repeat-containing protein [Micavibrio aeruginosavorus]|uniref:LVIVD repeat protein n=1 Tax=Micavibrio aeruginosavorus EPB TaxID=349215 RepID=M4VIS2_9BACT|nr:hypothetical protein [Micavibrio aeruginosavorus]AGH99098.1 hypothetical protein A11S_2303 [Micavibrio aeruginosavorus EPB]